MFSTASMVKIKVILSDYQRNEFLIYFSTDDGLFHEPDMQRLLTSLLLSCCCHIDRIDFSQPVPGLQAFADLYMAFLDHFEATSFGSSVFSQYVLLPMMQQQSVEYRKLVWTEHALTLRSVFLSPNQVSCYNFMMEYFCPIQFLIA